MSFLTDLFEGHTSNLGTDITHAFQGNELTQTLEGLGGLALAGTGIGLGIDALGGAGAILPDFLGGAAGSSAASTALPFADITADTAGATAGEAQSAISAALSGDTTGLAGATQAANFGTAASSGGDILTGGSALGVPQSSFDAANAALGAAGDTTTGGATGSGSGFLSNLTSGAVKSLTSNPLGIAAAAGGLGLQLIKGQQITANQKALESEAAQTAAQGSVLQQYLQTGTLPPALQAQVNQATAAAKARIVANYAAQGMDTDPTRNSALAQELNNIDIQAVASAGQIETQLLQTGINETGLSSQMYQALVGIDTANNNQLMQAIASFAAALGGGKTTINFGNTATKPAVSPTS